MRIITISQYRSKLRNQAVLALCELPHPSLSLSLCCFSKIGDFQVFFMLGMKIKVVSTHNWACLSVLQEMYRWT